MVDVVASGLVMVRQRRPTGPAHAVDEAWKKDVKAAMKKQGISQADLAAQIGVTPSAITVLFRTETKQTRLKPAIHRALGLVAPTPAPAIERDEAYQRLMRAWPSLSEDDRQLIIATSEALAQKSPSKR